MNTLQAILAFLFGQKYYVNIFCDRGTTNYWVSSQIFRSRAEADAHRFRNELQHSFRFIQTRSFRSREDFTSLLNNIHNSSVCCDRVAAKPQQP